MKKPNSKNYIGNPMKYFNDLNTYKSLPKAQTGNGEKTYEDYQSLLPPKTQKLYDKADKAQQEGKDRKSMRLNERGVGVMIRKDKRDKRAAKRAKRKNM